MIQDITLWTVTFYVNVSKTESPVILTGAKCLFFCVRLLQFIEFQRAISSFFDLTSDSRGEKEGKTLSWFLEKDDLFCLAFRCCDRHLKFPYPLKGSILKEDSRI